MSASDSSLPPNANLRQLRNRAKDLLKAHAAADAAALSFLKKNLPEWADLADEEVAVSALALKDVQRAVARHYGFAQWADLKGHLESGPEAGVSRERSTNEGQRVFVRGTREAVELLQAFRAGDERAVQRVRAAFESSEYIRKVGHRFGDGEAVINHPYNAQEIIAHEYGAVNWAALCLEGANSSDLVLPPGHPLVEAVLQADLPAVRRFLHEDAGLARARVPGGAWYLVGTVWNATVNQNSKVSKGDPRTATLLHHAAVRKGKADLARLLLEYGADVNALGYQDNCDVAPPIVLAAWEGDLQTMRVLLEAGAGIDLENALFTALEHGARDKAALLLRHGAVLDVHTAAMYGDLEALRALVEARPDSVDQKSAWRDRSPAAEAVNLGQLDAARLLIELGATLTPELAAALGEIDFLRAHTAADPAALDAEYGTQPLLSWATSTGQLEAIDFLLGQGADPNQGDTWGVTPLRKAPTPQAVERLVQGGADVNLVSRGQTPLATALYQGALEIARTLLELGADPDVRNHGGRTALHYALEAEGDAVAGTRLLLGHGADAAIADDEGRTPLALAEVKGRAAAADILRAARR